MIFAIAAAALIALGLAYEALGRARDERRLIPPGRLVSYGVEQQRGGRMHLYDLGSGSPGVVLEAGIGGSLLGWSLVQPAIAKFTRVCSYDRAGLGWSDPARAPRTLDNMVEELAVLLRSANVSPPYVLVGHSFGGLLMRAFAARYPEQIAGLVLVDPVGIATWAAATEHQRLRLKRGITLAKRGAILARLGIVRAALDVLALGGRIIPKVVSVTAAGTGTSVIEHLIGEVRLLPPETVPMIRSHWSNPKCFRGMAAYLECLPASAAQSLEITVPQTIPVTVLSAGTATRQELEEREHWVRQSIRGCHIRVTDSSHWIQVRRPDVVIEAVKNLVES